MLLIYRAGSLYIREQAHITSSSHILLNKPLQGMTQTECLPSACLPACLLALALELPHLSSLALAPLLELPRLSSLA